ncbi:MAG: SUMF1/EgtB/PvdO family nonheme iron enzyme [bacterium]|nr:SUMF1/EgtB/PvdO family nonheme iron enzyme [bacterium]
MIIREGTKNMAKGKRFFLLVLLCGCVLFTAWTLFGQDSAGGKAADFDWFKTVPWFLALGAIAFGVYQYMKRIKDAKAIEAAKLQAQREDKEVNRLNILLETKEQVKADLEAKDEVAQKKQVQEALTYEEKYRRGLTEALGNIQLLGSPDINDNAVKLEDTFVSLRISEEWRCEDRFHSASEECRQVVTPGEVMRRAFSKYRLLLVIGDPGSGKTTLLKYFTLRCMENSAAELGFKESVLPLFFPLRELVVNDNFQPAEPFHVSLEKWAERHGMTIPADQFKSWLETPPNEKNSPKILLLLDGLDEIAGRKGRENVCKWISSIHAGLTGACIVLTSRETGYRKVDGIELGVPHLRADILDFSPQQQEEFLGKWFRATALSGLPAKDETEADWRAKQTAWAEQRAQRIIDFLNKEDNKTLRELASVPLLLQIMAVIWKDKQHLPKTRPALYDAALNYLLEYRDTQRDITPLLSADESRRVLAPTALWMQQKEKDEVHGKELCTFIQPVLDTLQGSHKAEAVCLNWRNRVGVLADYDTEHFIFRHKSFREFLAGLQLVKDAFQPGCMEALVANFENEWWVETFRFFISKSDDKIFDSFIRVFFNSPVSEKLEKKRQLFLAELVREAPQRRIDALWELVNDDTLTFWRRRYVLDCLKIIKTPAALDAIDKADKSGWDNGNIKYAEDILGEFTVKIEMPVEREKAVFTIEHGESSFRNTFEYNAEYIKIPGGTYSYSVTEDMETVSDMYFSRHLVTNKRYRRFIAYLGGKEPELSEMLPPGTFKGRLWKFAETVDGFREYLEKESGDWQEKLQSALDDDKKFRGGDQPVVGISWYAARAYCVWLSCLEAVRRGESLAHMAESGSMYELPTETEWEWAAYSNPDGTMRKYPWPAEKGEASASLANFNKNVGATTPVSSYPEGATPLGLMDMAGNAWEWMVNYYADNKRVLALRGGSYSRDASFLFCGARDLNDPPDLRDYYVGFRVVLPGHFLVIRH